MLPPDRSATNSTMTVIPGWVVALPTPSNNALGTQSLSVEVAAVDAATVAAADDVRVVLSEPLREPTAEDGS